MMAVITSMFDEMDEKRKQLLLDNQEYLADMLDYAIEQLESIAENDEIYLIDQGKVCDNYDSIFECLKHWAIERQGNM